MTGEGSAFLEGTCLAMAAVDCGQCKGVGLGVRKGPCRCVRRAIFRVCWAFFQVCDNELGAVTLDLSYNPGVLHGRGVRQWNWGRKYQEYRADFAIALRALGEMEQRVFLAHYLDGRDYAACCARLHLDRGTFWHAVYRMQEQMGDQMLRRGMYPLAEYFRGNSMTHKLPTTSRGATHGVHLSAESGMR
jgi:hypothetical protein